MKQITINTFHKYMNFEEIIPVKVVPVPEITLADCYVGKHGKHWFVWEYLTGRPVSQFNDTKIKAIESAVKIMEQHARFVKQAIAMHPHINTPTA